MTENKHCRICGRQKSLTDDHVPPRALQLYLKCEDWVYYTYLGEGGKPKFKQKGTSFKSICASCNNNFLGSLYDPELVRVCKLVISHLMSTIIMTPYRTVSYEPYSFCRSLIGHFLAARRKASDTKIDQILREYFWGMRKDLDGLNIFYWCYQHESRIIFRDIGFRYNDRTRVGSALKFYPLAFFVVDSNEFYSLQSLGKVLHFPKGERADFRFNVNENAHEFWPEHTDFMGVIYGGEALQDAVYSKPLRRPQ